MRLMLCENYEEMSDKSADIVANQIAIKPESVLGLATGSTPEGMYKKLIAMYENRKVDFSRVKTFNLDEYYPISSENSQSYHYYMNEHLFSKVNIKDENINILNGQAENPYVECENFDKKIKEYGGIDLQILGIGTNGHIGFNEPAETLQSNTHLTTLSESTITANSRFFDDLSQVPTAALTMGMSSILHSKRIVLLACGKSKKQVVKELLNNDINTFIPATLLKVHPDVTIICDKEACCE